jgi:desulfoferrodoxin (superoxide reductase-like protein)
MESENKVSKFKELYHSNPEYKKKHLDYVKKKVYCEECGVYVSRCNIGHHKATKKHQNFCEILKLKDQLNSSESIKKELIKKIENALSN